MRKPQSILLSMTLLGLLSACAHAGPEGQRPSGPPPEAFSACENLAAGDQVSFSGRNGESIEATCEERDGKLVAVPTNPPKRR